MSILTRLQQLGGTLASSAKQTVEDMGTVSQRLIDVVTKKDEEKLRKEH